MKYQTNSDVQPNPQRKLLIHSLSGLIAGMSSVALGMPFDTCKIRIQTSNSGSFLSTLVSIIRNEGLSMLWKGAFFPLTTNGLCVSFVFTWYTELKLIFTDRNIQLTRQNLEYYICGGIAGSIGAILYCPLEHIRIRMALKGSAHHYLNSLDCVHKIVKNHGIKGLYRGMGVTTVRDFFWMSNYFFAFDKLKEHNTSRNPFINFMSGGLAGMAGWTGGFILDNIKSKMQADSLAMPVYKSARQIYRRFSLKELCGGYSIGIYRSIIVSAVTLGIYQTLNDKLE